MSAKPTKGIHRDVTTGEAVVIGPRGEEIRFTKDAIRSGVPVAEDNGTGGNAINVKAGLVVLSGDGDARALADPTPDTDDGKRLDIICLAAATGASIIPGTTFGDGTNDLAQFTTGEALSLIAYQGLWYVLSATCTVTTAA